MPRRYAGRDIVFVIYRELTRATAGVFKQKTPPPGIDRRWRARFCVRIYLEKLATAAASVGNTSNTVYSLVTCRISWNFEPR